MNGFAELVAATHFSFLRSAASPAELVERALALGLAGLGIADRNSVAGVVRAHVALRRARAEAAAAGRPPPALKLVSGARLVFVDGTPDIVAHPVNRAGWGRLTRLLTTGNLRAQKGDCQLALSDLLEAQEDLLLILLPASSATPQAAHPAPVAAAPLPHPLPVMGLEGALARLARAAPGRLWLGVSMPRRGDDARRLATLATLAARHDVLLLATGDVLCATPDQRPLHDVLACMRERLTLAEAGCRLEANAERHLKDAAEMRRLFRAAPQAVEATTAFLARVGFDLDQLRYSYPREPVPEGWQAQDWLEHLVTEAAHARYGTPLPDKVCRLLDEEFGLIRARDYASYFLTVHDLVRFARSRTPPILCQGRGSAANSIVCFLLGITSVDPERHDLLFSRFVSEERTEPPDIDVDFEHERREEVMQYVYARYGRHRAGIVATVIHFRPRSAVREVGRVLGFSEDVTARLAATIWGGFGREMEAARYREAGFDPEADEIRRLRGLVDELLEAPFPRHLSQHVGGFVLTEDRLDETVPLHNAAMEGRTFIEWDKDDIDALGLMKVDVLALGMLTCIARSFALMRAHGLGDHDLGVDLAADDPAVYDMLCRGDSIGVFQVESRAQINMLPRLKPRCLYDLTVQVAIVRPGPIEGDMVHPYLRRRAGLEPVDFPSPAPPHDPDELRRLLGQTFGVPIFQEQAMKLAIVAAGFTPSEANQLRCAMATFRNHGTIGSFRDKLVTGMTARGYTADFAERCFRQIEGFGSYGFPESHALSFARLVYVSAWIKCHHPAVFTCALLNAQPMGFYAPAQLVADARAHGVEVRPADVNHSAWDCTLERDATGAPALRLGFRLLDGFRAAWAEALVSRRPFADMEALSTRAGLPPAALRLLAEGDTLGSLDLGRRPALWEARRARGGQLPLFAAHDAPELAGEPPAGLPPMAPEEEVVADYQALRLSLKGHPMQFLRPQFRALGASSAAEVAATRNGRALRMAGVVLVRQRPGKGNAIFITLEDETGIVNLVLWARLFERLRRPVMTARLMLASGTVQVSREGVVHLMATDIRDCSDALDRLADGPPVPVPLAPADAVARPHATRPSRARGHHGHPRAVRLLPPSRDFH